MSQFLGCLLLQYSPDPWFPFLSFFLLSPSPWTVSDVPPPSSSHELTWLLVAETFFQLRKDHQQYPFPEKISSDLIIWTASSEFGTYSLCEQRRFRRACASAQSPQNLRCSLIQAVSQEEHSDRKPDPWLLWMAGHAQLKFVMTECSKTQIRLTRLICSKHQAGTLVNYEPCHQKTCLRGFLPGKNQTGLHSSRDSLEARNFEYRN